MIWTRCAKTVLYALVCCLICGVSVWIAAPMYSSDEMVTVYLRSMVLLGVAACAILGTGIYIWIFHTRKARRARTDALFWSVTGGVLLVAAVAVILRFGGITVDTSTETLYAAANLNLMLVGALPAPFLVRTLVVAAGVREHKTSRAVALGVAAAAILLYAVLIFSGNLMNTITYTIL